MRRDHGRFREKVGMRYRRRRLDRQGLIDACQFDGTNEYTITWKVSLRDEAKTNFGGTIGSATDEDVSPGLITVGNAGCGMAGTPVGGRVTRPAAGRLWRRCRLRSRGVWCRRSRGRAVARATRPCETSRPCRRPRLRAAEPRRSAGPRRSQQAGAGLRGSRRRGR
jgi:hypothetical protein